MNGIRTETFHFTDEQVRGHVRDTLAILDDLAVPTALLPIAFERVFDRLSAKAIAVEQVQPALGVPIIPRA